VSIEAAEAVLDFCGDELIVRVAVTAVTFSQCRTIDVPYRLRMVFILNFVLLFRGTDWIAKTESGLEYFGRIRFV